MTTQSTQTVTFQVSPNVTTPEEYYVNVQVGEVYQSASPIAGPALVVSKKWIHTTDGVRIELGLQPL
jgi:hypothetical protein